MERSRSRFHSGVEVGQVSVLSPGHSAVGSTGLVDNEGNSGNIQGVGTLRDRHCLKVEFEWWRGLAKKPHVESEQYFFHD